MLDKGRIYAVALLLMLALSIISMPLVLVQKVQLGGGAFSISYLFVAGGIAIACLYRLRHLGRYWDGVVSRTRAELGMLSLLIAAVSVINGPDQKFLISMTFWIVSSLIGLSLTSAGQRRLASGMEWLAVLLALVGIGLYQMNLPLFDFEEMASDMYFMNDNGYYRASSVFLNPNSFAYFLVFYLCLAARRERAHGWLSLAGCGAVLLALVLSDSRSATIACAVIALAFGIRQLRPEQARCIYFATNVVLGVAFVFLLAFAEDLHTFDIRFEKWHMALSIFGGDLSYLLSGIPGTVRLERNGVTFSDNMFLELLFKMGLLGFIFLLYFYVRMQSRASAILCGREMRDRVAAPYALFLLASSIPMFYSNYLYFYPVVVLHGLAVGIVLQPRLPCAMKKVVD